MRSYNQNFEMSSQHKLWHQEHLNWIEELDIFYGEGEEFISSLDDMKRKITLFQDEVKRLKSTIADHEVHINRHQVLLDSHSDYAHSDYTQMNEEHQDSIRSHSQSWSHIITLRKQYHQMAILLHAFEHGWRKLDEVI